MIRPFGMLVFWCLSGTLHAQTQTGFLEGLVTLGDDQPLPGATVTIRGTVLAMPIVTVSGAGGGYSVTLPPGSYSITVEAPGFVAARRDVTVAAGERRKRDFLLRPASAQPDDGAPIIDSVQSAAANRPGFLGGSDLAPSSIIVGFGRNTGPASLTAASSLPLGETLAGMSYALVTGNRQFLLYPIYAANSQFAATVPADVPPGPAMLFAENQGRRSSPYLVNIGGSQPGFFSIRQNGQLNGVFTRPDFSLITYQNPAQPGDVVIGWGTNWGMSPFDREPGVQDKRPLFEQFRLFVGGVQSAPEDILYAGSSGGVVAADQIVFRLGPMPLAGCGVPVFAAVQLAQGGAMKMSNVVTLPVSRNGAPCGDAHGFDSSEIRQVTNTGGYSVGASVLSEVLFDQNAQSRPLLRAEFNANVHTATSYEPPQPLGSCKPRWFPPNAANPFAPRSLGISGNYDLSLPSVSIPLRADSNIGPYAALFAAPANPLREGSYTLMFPLVGGSALPNLVSAEYRRRAGAARDSFNTRVAWPPNRDVCLSGVIDALINSNLPADVGVAYDRIYDYGPFGGELIRCFLPASQQGLEAVRTPLLQQFRLIDSLLAGVGSTRNRHTENITNTVRFFPLSSNKREPSGPLNQTKEIFDASRSSPVLDTSAFATCP